MASHKKKWKVTNPPSSLSGSNFLVGVPGGPRRHPGRGPCPAPRPFSIPSPGRACASSVPTAAPRPSTAAPLAWLPKFAPYYLEVTDPSGGLTCRPRLHYGCKYTRGVVGTHHPAGLSPTNPVLTKSPIIRVSGYTIHTLPSKSTPPLRDDCTWTIVETRVGAVPGTLLDSEKGGFVGSHKTLGKPWGERFLESAHDSHRFAFAAPHPTTALPPKFHL